MEISPENKIEDEKGHKEFLDALSREGAVISFESDNNLARRLTFGFQLEDLKERAVVTVKVLFEGDNQENLTITNMTVLPDEAKDKGLGSNVVQLVIKNSKGNFLKILATQVSDTKSEEFWLDNGFTKCEGENPCNDYEFKLN